MKKRFLAAAAGIALVLTGCGIKRMKIEKKDNEEVFGYQQITQEEAKTIMENEKNSVVVDVRRQDEYEQGHIPGAILIPNESIDTERPEQLQDLSQTILIYCRSGNRSKQAAKKLCKMGYTNIYEFGGINTWTEETVTGKEPESQKAVLLFDSFDGGGPSYELKIDDPEIISYEQHSKYAKDDHEQMCGAGYDVVFTFTGKKEGQTKMVIEQRSPIADNQDFHYDVMVDDDLRVTIELNRVEEIER